MSHQTTVHNEQTKLLATFLNGLGIALFAVGGLAPLSSVIYANRAPDWRQVLGVLICFFGAFALHYLARNVLTRLKQ
jgi:hypothetical protein